MGSLFSHNKTSKDNVSIIVNHIYPIYYIPNAVIADREALLVVESWNKIVNNTSLHWKDISKAENECKHLSSLSMFYELFYQRLFDVSPSSKQLFSKSIQVQGKALVHMISGAISLLKDTTNLVSALQKLAIGHTSKGVLATQYGTVGEVLLWTFAQCLQHEFDTETQTAWIKLYSVMLSVIIPAAIGEEAKQIDISLMTSKSNSFKAANTNTTNTSSRIAAA